MKSFARLGTNVLALWIWIPLLPIAITWGAPWPAGWGPLTALAVAALLTLAVWSVFKALDFEIAPQTATVSGAIVVLTFTFGGLMHLGWLLVAGVCWSLVARRERTYPEAAAGVLLGILVGGLGYWLAIIVIYFGR
ncbi:hypothetical protein [Amycolatopsis thailandensis]|uniref:Uncharacterized protein n=1 Tax=Amycolatopsis thailandensis TaxID=589330 RepID=A0A229SCW8_9PSEU|nr:hypothetical protein [Amycolatopsis thailandensis]OXM56690.1 hypothetical protein CFP71_11760 [Amycolatopsis thailandensis]